MKEDGHGEGDHDEEQDDDEAGHVQEGSLNKVHIEREKIGGLHDLNESDQDGDEADCVQLSGEVGVESAQPRVVTEQELKEDVKHCSVADIVHRLEVLEPLLEKLTKLLNKK